MFPAFPDVRASDADRERTAAYLNHHCAQGRLSLDELSARADAAYRATGLGELEALTADLPGDPDAPRTPARGARARLGPVLALALTLITVVAVAALLPGEVMAPLLMLGLPLVVMVLVTVLPVALPVLAVVWLVRSLDRSAREDRRAVAARRARTELPPGRGPGRVQLRTWRW